MVSPAYAQMTSSGGNVFVADEGTHGFEVWRSNGTAAGTKLLPGHGTRDPAVPTFPGELTDVDGTLFFRRRWLQPDTH